MNPYYEEEGIVIYNADCLEVMPQLERVDLVVTSPPYDNLREYKGYSFNFEDIAKELFKCVSIGGVVVWVVGDATINGSETGTSFKQALYFKEIGFNLHDTMIYQKKSCYAHDPRNKRYKAMFEYMFIISNGKPKTYNEIKDVPNKHAGKILKGTAGRDKQGKKRKLKPIVISDFQARSNIWVIPSSEKSNHPAIFPKKLAYDHIVSWSNKEEIILDPMCGSGTTLCACKELTRRGIGIEISKEYCDIAISRLRNTQKDMFL